MTTQSPDPTPELVRLGDSLEQGATRQLGASRRRSRTIRAAAGLAAVALLLTATAAAAGLFTPKQVAAGMPAGSVIFGNTAPACVLDADGSTYHCTLDATPQSDTTGLTPAAGSPAVAKQATPDTVADYTGYKEPIGIDGVVAGGCVGVSADGLAWDCYIGQDAVDQMIISQDFLGEPMLGPGRG